MPYDWLGSIIQGITLEYAVTLNGNIYFTWKEVILSTQNKAPVFPLDQFSSTSEVISPNLSLV